MRGLYRRDLGDARWPEAPALCPGGVEHVWLFSPPGISANLTSPDASHTRRSPDAAQRQQNAVWMRQPISQQRSELNRDAILYLVFFELTSILPGAC